MFNETNALPAGLLQAQTTELLDLLGSPTLIHLEGEIKQPLFICTLLHGNETTGFYAIQELLRSYSGRPLPRSISLFIGNVEAAATKQRRLEQQADYNRIWPGTHHSASAETDMMKNVTGIMRRRKPFASIDIHNNTGHNPHYSCVNILNSHCLQLAGLFGNIVVHFTSPKGVQSSAFSDFCPAIVLECGQSGKADGITHSLNFLQSVLSLEKIPADQPEHIKLYHTVARTMIPELYSFSTRQDTDIQLIQEMESQNFHELASGSLFARKNPESLAQFVVTNESDEDVTADFFETKNDKILLKKAVTLSMYTTNETAVRQDCLCYLMERIHFT